jgi:hypothetical protein
MTEKQVLGFKPHTRLERISDQHSQHMQDRNHRPQRCDDSTSQRESNAGWNFRKGQGSHWLGANCPIVAMEQSMTPDFLAGFFFALIPSMIVVAWFVGRASAADRDPRRKSLDRQL